MNELRKLVWRYNAGYYLRERLRDDFIEETERLRARARARCGQIEVSPEGRMVASGNARAFEVAALETERSAQSARFEDGLKAIDTARALLDSFDEIYFAHAAISEAAERLSKLDRFLLDRAFPAIEDFRVLIVRARQFFTADKYRTARFIAEETSKSLASITAVAPEGEGPPVAVTKGLVHQERLADSLEMLGVAATDNHRICQAVALLRACLAARQFALAETLLGDLDNENAGLDMFLWQKNHAERSGASDAVSQVMMVVNPLHGGGIIDWRRAAALLVDESLRSASRRLTERALAAASGE